MLSLNNLKLARRLALAFGVLTLFVCGITITAWWGLHTVNSSMDEAVDEMKHLRETGQFMSDMDNINLDIWHLLATTENSQKQAINADIAKLRATYYQRLSTLKTNITAQQGKELLRQIESDTAEARKINTQVLKLALEEGKAAEAQKLFATEGLDANAKTDAALDKMDDWQEKRMQDADHAAKATLAFVQKALLGVTLLVVALAIIFAFIITRSVTVPLKASVAILGRMSEGDLSRNVPAELQRRQDEAGELSRSLQMMTENLRRLLHEVAGGVQTLASSATELSAISSQTASGVNTMSAKSATVAAAAEEASANAVSVAAGMEQAATNLASVASATEEMSATVGEIAGNSEKARAISEQAAAQADNISGLMRQLGQAAQDIGKVTETITDISSQTNLLALNATIEAARAGVAGKGFAVVASEIKELARQTAAATEDIKTRISGVQLSAGSAIADIEKISAVIKEVSGIVTSIAAAIEEQATATKDVAGNISQASSGVKDSNERMAQTATVSKVMSKDVAEINAAVGEVRRGGEQVQASAAELSKLSEELKNLVAQFTLTESSLRSTLDVPPDARLAQSPALDATLPKKRNGHQQPEYTHAV